MKLYTEEQVRVAMSMSFLKDYEIASTKQIIESLKSIELPSDEEINQESEATYRGHPNNPKDHPEWTYNQDINAPRKRKAFIKGAKWVIEQIKQQDNGKRICKL